VQIAPTPRKKAAKAAFAAAKVQHAKAVDLAAKLQHDAVEQELAVRLAVDDLQPAACRRFPAAIRA
jgi:hypothetical protein